MSENLPAVPVQVGGGFELARALVQASLACKPVPHDKRNKHHGFDYTSAEAILTEARVAMANAGLSLVPLETSLNGWDRQGEDRFELERKFLLIHSSGERYPVIIRWPVCPEKGRPLDKAVAIADTTSLAYYLRDLLLMPRCNPADDLAGREEQPAPPPRKEKPAPDPKGPCGDKWLARVRELCDAKGIALRDLVAPYLSPHAQIETLTREAAVTVAAQLKALPDKSATPAPPPAAPSPAAAPQASPLDRWRDKPPQTGVEFAGYVSALNDKLVGEGRSKQGELGKYIAECARQEGLPVRWVDWDAEAVKMGVGLARSFAGTHPAKKPA